MATEGVNIAISLKADTDRSAAQYRAVKGHTTARTFTLAGAGDGGMGILQDKPAAAGRVGKIVTQGLSKAVLGGTVTLAAGFPELTSDANGALVLSSSIPGSTGVAYAIEAGVSGNIISVYVIGG